MKKIPSFEEFLNEHDFNNIKEGRSFTKQQIKSKAIEILKDLGISRPDNNLIQDTINYLRNLIDSEKSGVVFDSIKNSNMLEESINTRLRSQIVVDLKRANFKRDVDFEFIGSQLYAKDIDIANELTDKLSDKYKFVIQYGKVEDDGRIPINVAKK